MNKKDTIINKINNDITYYYTNNRTKKNFLLMIKGIIYAIV